MNTQPIPSVTFNGIVRTTVYRGAAVYVGGDFTSAKVNGKSFARAGLAAVDARTGALLDWTPSANGSVRGLAADDDDIYAIGEFTSISGQRRDSLAKINAVSGAVAPTFKHNIGGQPRAVALGNGKLYVGGVMTSVDGTPVGRLAAFNLSTGALDPSWRPVAADSVEALTFTSKRVYIGGKFQTVNAAPHTAKIAAVSPSDGSVDPGFDAQISAMVLDIAVTDSAVYAAIAGQGGRLTSMALNGLANWTTTTDGDVQAVTALDGVVYLGGHFDRVCLSPNTGPKGVCIDGSVARIKLAAVNTAGQLLNWTANGNGVKGVFSLSQSRALGQLVAAGDFTAVNGAAKQRFALFNLPAANPAMLAMPAVLTGSGRR